MLYSFIFLHGHHGFISETVNHVYWEDALRTFLLRMLDKLTKDDKMQITVISTWATKLYLDKVPIVTILSFLKLYGIYHVGIIASILGFTAFPVLFPGNCLEM